MRKIKPITSLKQLTLKQYCQILSKTMLEKKNQKERGDEEAIADTHELLGIVYPSYNLEDIKRMKAIDTMTVAASLISLLNEGTEYEAPPQIIKIGLESYGLHPEPSTIESGAFVDIQTLLGNPTWENLLLIYAILYRPILSQLGGKLYSVVSYSDEKDADVRERARVMGDNLDALFARNLLSSFLGARN